MTLDLVVFERSVVRDRQGELFGALERLPLQGSRPNTNDLGLAAAEVDSDTADPLGHLGHGMTKNNSWNKNVEYDKKLYRRILRSTADWPGSMAKLEWP